jgi:alpha-tubulin suppressor-like RCC1 family protein
MSRPTLSLLALLGAFFTLAVPAQAATVATGESTTCAVRGTGSVACWGDSSHGQLGTGVPGNSASPVWVPGIKTATAVSVGGTSACALLANGTIQCWGDADTSGSGLADSDGLPHPVVGITGATAVTVGYSHSCALLGSGEVRCWGVGTSGQLGDGTTDDSATPVTVTGLTDARDVSAGDTTTCAVRAVGGAVCWGDGSGYGLLGSGVHDDPLTTPGVVSYLSTAKSISVAADHACAILTTGSVSCWGNGSDGQLGNGQSGFLNSQDKPGSINGLTDAVAITTGTSHTCVTRTGGAVSCWGDSAYGQLGARTTDAVTPFVIPGLAGVTDITAGGNRTCITAGTAVSCWGYGAAGELGTGAGFSASAVGVSGLTGAVGSAGGQATSCAAQSAGTVKCWGWADLGLLGDGAGAGSGELSLDHQLNAGAPVALPNVTGATAVSMGGVFGCALQAAGSVKCWGWNNSGSVGVNAGFSLYSPIPPSTVQNLSGATAISAGADFACAIVAAGAVKCWGDRTYGQLGDGRASQSASVSGTPVPVDVPGLTGATKLASGGDHACVIVSGSVKCWGEDADGQLGDGPTDSSSTEAESPVVTVSGLTDAVAIAASDSRTCAVKADHSVVCWGLTGDAPSADSNAPFAIAGVSTATAIALGSGHSCFIRTDHGVSCWGRAFGSDALTTTTPQSVAGITDAASISAGSATTCAVRTGGQVACWGDGSRGQLGDGDFPTGHHPLQRTPTAVTFSADPNQQPVDPGPVDPGTNPGTNPGGGTPDTKVVTPPATKPAAPVKPSVPSDPTGTLWFHNGTLGMRGFLIKPTKAGKCPKRATVLTVGATAATKKLKLRMTVKSVLTPKKLCALTGTIKLPGKLATATKIKVTVSGTGLTTKAKGLKPV